MKKAIAFLLSVMVLLTCAFPAFAFSDPSFRDIVNSVLKKTWICPECATECSGNFCSNCGTQKPSASSPSGIGEISAWQTEYGDTCVSWLANGTKGPYKLTYTTDYWSQNWYEESSYRGTSATLQFLIPGVTYEITVTDTNTNASNNLTYTVPAPIFREFVTGNKYLKMTESRFSASESKANRLSTFEVRVYWPQLKYSRCYQGKLVLKTPLGYSSSVRYFDQFTLENQYSYTYMTYSLYADWLEEAEAEFGYIPSGTYTFEMYFDGQLYDYVSFTVTQ